MELDSRVAMLTGAGRLGTAIAVELARAGASVGVVDVNAVAAAKVANVARAGGAPKATHVAAPLEYSRFEVSVPTSFPVTTSQR